MTPNNETQEEYEEAENELKKLETSENKEKVRYYN
jgi:hypothetical protein